jgi:hypothetical protein
MTVNWSPERSMRVWHSTSPSPRIPRRAKNEFPSGQLPSPHQIVAKSPSRAVGHARGEEISAHRRNWSARRSEEDSRRVAAGIIGAARNEVRDPRGKPSHRLDWSHSEYSAVGAVGSRKTTDACTTNEPNTLFSHRRCRNAPSCRK